ncbi:MAG: aryl-sulfate sulfotransferase [Bacteroidetes bacterium]|nr:aryl-sulfate sulfotransferase [Bacteroidota bacterium]
MLQKITLRLALAFSMFLSYSTQAQQWGNYTLYSTLNGTTTYLVDTNGTTFKTWTHTSANKNGYSAYLIPGGTLLRSVARSGNSFMGGPICGQVQKVDWNGTIIWDFVYSTTNYCSHHDIHPMPNGNVLVIAYERRTAAEVFAAGSTTSIEMWPDKIVEIEPVGLNGGNIVWEWKAWDHLVQNVDPLKANYQTSIVNNPQLLNINYNTAKDWMHMNGVSYNPMLDQITFSSHNLDEIYVIDHSTTTAEAAGHTGGNSGKGGDILYRWGNPLAYQAGGTATINVVHDAHWNPENVPNPGYLCAYNNKGISSNASCGDQVAPPYNGYNYTITPGSAFLPATYTLRQPSGGYNSNMGNMQVLPNGNTIICISTAGVIKEFDPNGNLLWSKTTTGSTPKAFRYDSCFVFNPAPAIPIVTENNDTLYSTPAVTYQWYFNGYQIAGATSQTYVPTQSGNYKVRITDANGCVLQYSVDNFITVATGISETNNSIELNLYPNPTKGVLIIQHNYSNEPFEVLVTDEVGKLLISEKNSAYVDLSSFETGIYFVTIITSSAGKTTQRISHIR